VGVRLCKCVTRAITATLMVCLSEVAASAQNLPPAEIPGNFKLDLETAARLRPQLIAASIPATNDYATGGLVFARLVQQLHPSSSVRFGWQLRIVENDQLNAYSSPDGSVYVESGLAKLAGASAGLWAAIVSHEMAHILRRDWARRYIYQRYLERGGAETIVLGDPSLPSATWNDSEKASADMGQFCRQMELEADCEGLMLMAKAGYHPDFVPALHHLLHARGVKANASLYAMHPCWEERDRELSSAYTEASIEFEHRWPAWYASPGGNPPVVVFADEPKVKKTSANEWQIQVPMRCQNLAGAVEVVLHASAGHGKGRHSEEISDMSGGNELRQVTGCTSPTTTVVFSFVDPESGRKSNTRWTDVYVLDAWGSVLARADLPKLPR